MLAVACVALAMSPASAGDAVETVARVKRSVVAIGTYDPLRIPRFAFRGTGFAVGDGRIVVTNAHVLPPTTGTREALGVMTPSDGDGEPRFREAVRAGIDTGSDLAALRIEGSALPALRIDDSDAAADGQPILITGFPIGSVLGLFAATHRGIVAAVTPIALPQGRASELTASVIKQLAAGHLRLLQLDVTAFAGNSGSPVYDPATGVVLGVVNMVVARDTKEGALSRPTGITYAIPAKHVRELIAGLR